MGQDGAQQMRVSGYPWGGQEGEGQTKVNEPPPQLSGPGCLAEIPAGPLVGTWGDADGNPGIRQVTESQPTAGQATTNQRQSLIPEDGAWGGRGGDDRGRVGLARGRSWNRALAHDRGLKVTTVCRWVCGSVHARAWSLRVILCLGFNILQTKTKENKTM